MQKILFTNSNNLKYFAFRLLFCSFLAQLFLTNCTSVENESGVTPEDIQNGKTASLTIKRKKSNWVSILANVNVYINETPMGYVENGEERTFYFVPSKSGTARIRFESSDIDLAGISEAISKDTTLTSRLRKEFQLKVRTKDVIKFYCSLDSKELFVRRIED